MDIGEDIRNALTLEQRERLGRVVEDALLLQQQQLKSSTQHPTRSDGFKPADSGLGKSRPGIATTEFWLAAVAIAGPTLLQSVPPEWSTSIAGVVAAVYAIARAIVKVAEARPPAGS